MNLMNVVYGLKFDKKKGEITIYKDKTSIGIAYTGLKKLELFPTIDFSTNGCEVQLVKPKFKK
jgi:hypothetical protein